MRPIQWKDAPHETLFWTTIIVLAITSLLIFTRTVGGL
jgi:hypothetical protein